ncbi:MAG: hypothetical protein KAH46_01815, partial [Mycobacterium sp.]|nr:hypothetical protein [Mycobacterium sp.]
EYGLPDRWIGQRVKQSSKGAAPSSTARLSYLEMFISRASRSRADVDVGSTGHVDTNDLSSKLS